MSNKLDTTDLVARYKQQAMQRAIETKINNYVMAGISYEVIKDADGTIVDAVTASDKKTRAYSEDMLEYEELEQESPKDLYNRKEIQFSSSVKLPSMDYCQEYWKTSQTTILVPSKYINTTKKPPISTLIGISTLSGKEGCYTIDQSGKGARIMSIKRIKKLYENLTETRKIKSSTINSHIRKLTKLKTKEFEFVTLVTPQGSEEQYYKLDYSDGFVLIDLRIIHYMLTCYSDNLIQAYIVFLWNCRSGWSQLTREQMAVHLGLTMHSDKQAKMIMDKLVLDGFVEQRTQYHSVPIVDKTTGIPKSITMPYFEYRVVTLDEIKDDE
jgi:hypothetical protein